MNHIVITAPARNDLKEINFYLAQFNPNAAKRFQQRLKELCQRLAVFPNMGRLWTNLHPPLRSFPLDKYLIFYRPIEEGIEVVRVVSGYRDLETLFDTGELNN
ncbi:MAG: type II toxin-antitoxin system RelE/ParE family toxin [Oscillatoria sp. PMC 1051.18]|nr:type II toxin-antitoxin system RelE/ParE family toxin [Oscillatoria sp. PMC 1050.18]MEC5032427.1 type II toxin-antitoxin system RelE/ParE family toxin [Oscillatoria sp. PMC 1051.18]